MLFAFIIFFTAFAAAPGGTQSPPAPVLVITKDDIRIEQDIAGGYHLWIRKTADIGSVLITESTEDPAGKSASYALRDRNKNPVNGEEKRILNGKFLDTSNGLYSLIDSTPEPYQPFGEAFHVFIPYVVVYGYPGSREGEIQVLDGTFLSIRAFAKPYADYSGPYKDNPFVMRMVQKVNEGPPGKFDENAVQSFTDIARQGGGKAERSTSDDLPKTITGVLDSAKGPDLDLVLALDTTASMTDDLVTLKKTLVPMIREHTDRFTSFRVGLLLYRDYFEDYLTRPLPFTDNLDKLQALITAAAAAGGRDIPEAVYEALYMSIISYQWLASSRLIILVGDAPPHPRPRGNVTPDMVFSAAKDKGIEITTIILPD
jgi:hypothetical protein